VGNAGWDQQDRVYEPVVRPFCRGCHLSFNGLPFDTSDAFEQMGFMVQLNVCDQQGIPHALLTWDTFWQSTPYAPGVLLDDMAGTSQWSTTTCPF
jgi:hypothetical protein